MIINKGYTTYSSYHCLIGCVENYMKYYKSNFTGVDLFFYSKGFEIKYLNKGKNKYVIESSNRFLDTLEEVGIHYHDIKIRQAGNDFKMYLIQLIEEEKALIIKASSNKLNYDPIFVHNQPTVHYFNLVGYDYNTDKFCISDSFIPAYTPFCKQLWVEAPEFIKMCESKKELIVLDFQNHVVGKRDTSKIVKAQLECYLNEKKRNNIFCGKMAIKEMLYDVECLLKKELSISIVLEMNFQLRVYGFLMGREYLRDFLYRSEKAKFANCLSELINEWKKKQLLLTKCVMTKNYKKLEQTFEEMNNLCTAEEILFAQIVSIL